MYFNCDVKRNPSIEFTIIYYSLCIVSGWRGRGGGREREREYKSVCVLPRDLKPENILLDTAGHIQITDFGTAKLIADDEGEQLQLSSAVNPEMLMLVKVNY